MTTIFDYTDYQAWLRDFYAAKKQANVWFSYRYMASVVHMDASHLVKILSGRRHIASRSIERFITLCELKGREARYFEAMVRFCKARTASEAKQHYEELIALKDVKKFTLEKGQYEFYATWYHAAIFSLLQVYPFRGDYRELAAMLTPAITPREAKESVALLQRLSLVRKTDDGRYLLTDAYLTCGDAGRPVMIRNYQQQTMALAAQSLERHAREVRNISTVTVTVNQGDLMKIDEILSRFRTELLKFSRQTENPDAVYQLNIQFFPMAVCPHPSAGEQT